MRLFRDENGQTLVITALCMTCFMGFVALAVDVGLLFNDRRKLQITADAAATAAALQYLYIYNSTSNQSTAQTAAITAGNAVNNLGSVAVTVNTNPNSPAAHRSCAGTTCYFEAIATETEPNGFLGTFVDLYSHAKSSGLTVNARAVAGTPGTATNCAYITAPSGVALTTQGNWNVTASCGVYFNTTDGSPESDKGNAAKSGVSGSSITQVGPLPSDVTIAPGSGATSVSQTLPQNIPFSNITPPTPTGCVAWTNQNTPGCYSGSVQLAGTLASGTYIFTGDVEIKTSVTATNVALDINSGTMTIDPGNATVSITAPTSGTFSGVSIFMPSTNSSALSLQAGSSSLNLGGGWLVAPSAQLSLQDKGGGITVGGLVINSIDNKTSTLNVTGYTASTSPQKYVSLVE